MKYLIFLLLPFFACTTQEEVTQENISNTSTVISNVNVVDVRDGSIDEGQFVVVDSGKISRILDQAAEWPESVALIDGSGKYLMPGLAEMHAHIPSPPQSQELIDQTLFLYLSNGVTTIRGMLGHPLHLELREQAKNNEILSPRIFTSSPSFNGNTVQTVAQAREKVVSAKEADYDFLKLHPGIQLEVFNEIVRTAHEVDIPFAGHVSVDVGIRRALESGYASIDHVDGFLEGLVPEDANVQPDENGFFGYNFTMLADTSTIGELVQMSGENEVWVVPTQALFDRWFSPEAADMLAEAPEMKYMPKSTLENWVERKTELVGGAEYSAEQWESFNAIRHEMIHQLHENGQGLLLGSDAPQVFNVPGFSIHHELNGMLQSGLTPLEAIQIGTINPAVFFEMEGEFGEVIEGASADLILTNANPLESLEAIKSPAGVMVRGRWLSRDDINIRLEEIAQKNQSL
ncbi:imidazolonepropionase-like amidohydrolase [Catalinimonas alkaloidigena]|uniref:amidohydrolase family protein n=1 Tax=Catalinimonas alkaloidigena TaxID=1075417 RepID=UPI0024065C58|nr:amidohydrolase family protein [Catalinimonas alkaloidigena]MDF9798097.1 imidazolonepropionase-like amidohydrolase [Catalinimonas alkaloidigena]